MRAESFHVHKNQCMQILNLSSPDDIEKGEVETYFVLYFPVYTWEKVGCCNVYTYHEQVYSLI